MILFNSIVLFILTMFLTCRVIGGESEESLVLMFKKNRNSLYIMCTVFALTLFDTKAAIAWDVEYCPDPSAIETIFYDIKSSVPSRFVDTDWDQVNDEIRSLLSDILSDHTNISITRADKPFSELAVDHPKAIFLRVVYSYAPQKAFSTKLDGPGLVLWLETTTYYPLEENGKPEPLTQRSPYKFQTIPKKEAGFGSPFTSGLLHPLTLLGCDILKQTSTKRCSDPLRPGSNKIVNQTSECVERSEAEKRETLSRSRKLYMQLHSK